MDFYEIQKYILYHYTKGVELWRSPCLFSYGCELEFLASLWLLLLIFNFLNPWLHVPVICEFENIFLCDCDWSCFLIIIVWLWIGKLQFWDCDWNFFVPVTVIVNGTPMGVLIFKLHFRFHIYRTSRSWDMSNANRYMNKKTVFTSLFPWSVINVNNYN